MDRRQFVVGTTVVAAALAAGVTPAAAAPAELSPILAGRVDKMLCVFYQAEDSRLGVKPVIPLAEQIIPVSSVTEAENIFLSSLPEPSLIYSEARMIEMNPRHDYNDPDRTEDFVLSPIAIMLFRQSNLIAARSRRGCGNVVVGHPNSFSRMGIADDGAKIGRWTHVGSLNNAIDLWASSDMPEDRFHIVYNGGEADGPGSVGRNEKGDLVYVKRINRPDTFGNAHDYAGSLGLEWA